MDPAYQKKFVIILSAVVIGALIAAVVFLNTEADSKAAERGQQQETAAPK